MTVWRSLVAWLAAMSFDPATADKEPPRSAAAVAAAYASFRPDTPVPPAPVPPPAVKCQCNGAKVIKHDGSIPQPCPCGDKCVCKPGGK